MGILTNRQRDGLLNVMYEQHRLAPIKSSIYRISEKHVVLSLSLVDGFSSHLLCYFIDSSRKLVKLTCTLAYPHVTFLNVLKHYQDQTKVAFLTVVFFLSTHSMFWLKNKKDKSFQLLGTLIWRPFEHA